MATVEEIAAVCVAHWEKYHCRTQEARDKDAALNKRLYEHPAYDLLMALIDDEGVFDLLNEVIQILKRYREILDSIDDGKGPVV